ncbi:cupin domain-containing protein [Azorhizobium doebereinerae]|uniref:cupin domain-containing protein n=1 Tax=Azorhizobium doebereinerae TaxID=281091 RepID=UPI000421E9F8|nr:cupin domain-containing protein [Azorhizobium doebereinerae]
MMKQRRVRSPSASGAAAAVPAPAGETTEDDRALGLAIRAARLSRGRSLQRVAEAAGISVGLLSQIERGISSPSVRALRAICGALDVEVQALFGGEDAASAEAPRHILRVHQRRRLNLGGKGLVKDFLTAGNSGALQIMEIVLAPGGSSGLEPYHHVGEEGGVVLAGALELVIDGAVHRLGPGDAFCFESTLPHRFSNVADGETRVLWITTPPVW